MLRRCSRVGFAGLAAILFTVPTAAQQEESSPPIGFAPRSRAAYARAEARALAVPTPNNARSWLRTLTEEPHIAGSKADRKTAEFVRDKLKEWGWKTEVAEYPVLLNVPLAVGPGPGDVSPALELVRPVKKKLSLVEAPLTTDKDSASPDASSAFHGYGVSGDATGQVVYANYGRPEDFKALEMMGVELKGKIVLARYGELFRGLKVRNAQKRGAVGILIYSDPADDGYDKGDTYPNGPYRPGSAIQRGSVQFLSLGPGDPSTPFGPSIEGANRLPVNRWDGFPLAGGLRDLHKNDRDGGIISAMRRAPDSGHYPVVSDADIAAWERTAHLKREDYFATIPSLPISYDTARPILEALGGANVPTGWQGGLPFAYHIGPGPAEVHMTIAMKYEVKPIWNVVATIEGSVERDRWVMIGNHRDAWVYGAVDPGSGTAATLEMCRAIGESVKKGWKPRRTLVYTSWDAEEYGLVGSTEWAEHHASEVAQKAALMLNVDSAVAGQDLDLGGVPSLRELALDAAGAVREERSGKTLREVWTAHRRSAWAAHSPVDLFDPVWDPVPESPPGVDSAATRATARFSPQMGWLGSGSDYTVFIDHLGVPALDAGFHGRYGVYHSIYDNFTWMEKFGDPEFITHVMAARLYTAVAMRAAGAEVIPLKFVPYGEALREHVDELRRIVERKARGAEPNAAHSPLAFEGLPRLVAAVRAFQTQAAALDGATAALAEREGVSDAELARVNDALVRVERSFLIPKGLPQRPWFKHAIYAPGLTTGYAAWPLPGIRQAIEDNDAALLTAQVAAVIDRLEAATSAMKRAHDAATAKP
jgi:N-acetylated-alpha-linked acidic dipeptidase